MIYLYKGGVFEGDTQIDGCENEHYVHLKFLVEKFRLELQDYGYLQGLEHPLKDLETALFHLEHDLHAIKIKGTDYTIGNVKEDALPTA